MRYDLDNKRNKLRAGLKVYMGEDGAFFCGYRVFAGMFRIEGTEPAHGAPDPQSALSDAMRAFRRECARLNPTQQLVVDLWLRQINRSCAT